MPQSRTSIYKYVIALGVTALSLSGCALFAPLPEPTTLDDRLAMFPRSGLAFEEPVTIRWNAHQVPYIEAQNDADAAYAVGLVHAHLRLGQMELARRIARGRIAELAGPFGGVIGLDGAIRAFGLANGVSSSVASMPPETRAWVDRYVQGLNDYIEASKALPHEFKVGAFSREPWTAEDVLIIGRLGSLDVTWFRWLRLLPRRGEPGWSELLQEALKPARENPVSFEKSDASLPEQGLTKGAAYLPSLPPGSKLLDDALRSFQRHGSNTFVVGGRKTTSGSGLIANDPHLGFLLPNVWFLVGLKTPDMHTVGFMAPGLPIFTLGRNEHIGWGGTNLHAAQSDLVDVSDLPESAFTKKKETIKVRFRWASSVEYRMSPYGPVVTDIPLIRETFNIGDDVDVALRWVGHQTSDEISSLLKVQKATSFEEFRSAFKGYAQPALNMLYADKDGSIGHVIAARLPRRTEKKPKDIIVTPEESDRAWATLLDPTDLPYAFSPDKAYLASSNNRPTETDFPVGYFFAAPDRVERLADVLSKEETITWQDLAVLQRDVYAASSVALRDALMERIDEFGDGMSLDSVQQGMLDMLRNWDGHYRAQSAGTLAFEALTVSLAPKMAPDEIKTDEDLDNQDAVALKQLLLKRLAGLDNDALKPMIAPALSFAQGVVAESGRWGEIHRLSLSYPLRNLPVIGDKYPTTDLPVGGSSETVMKTAHAPTVKKHTARYGSQARHVSDLSDPNANYFVLTGGQDGWLNSSTFMDQIELWQEGEYIRMPLSQEFVEAEFPLVVELKGE